VEASESGRPGRELTQEQRERVLLSLVVLRCQTGDESAFEELLRRFGRQTHNHLRAIVGEDADDIQQEVWFRVFRHIAELTDVTAFRTWLFAVTRHSAVNALRRMKRSIEFVDASVLELPSTEAMVPAVDEAFEVDDAARLALDQLPSHQREAAVLRYLNDLSYAEIAIVQGCSIGTIRSRLHHARRRLQALMVRT
jgi:RNA polymerase sigma-70 factor, ECF subfamily